MSPVVSPPHWVHFTLMAVVCFAAGALVSQWIRLCQLQPGATSEEDAWIPTRNLIAARSRNPTLERLDALGYIDPTCDSRSDLAGVILNDPRTLDFGAR